MIYLLILKIKILKLRTKKKILDIKTQITILNEKINLKDNNLKHLKTL